MMYSSSVITFDEYRKRVLDEKVRVRKVFQSRSFSLSDRLNMLPLEDLPLARPQKVEILRDFIIQDALEELMNAYAGGDVWNIDCLRVGRVLCGRPSMHISSIAKEMDYCESIVMDRSPSDTSTDAQNMKSVLGILILAVEGGRNVSVQFRGIVEDARKNGCFVSDARMLLYGLMCEDLNQVIRCESPYPLLSSQDLRVLREEVMNS